jgi:anti-anti-sigma factor
MKRHVTASTIGVGARQRETNGSVASVRSLHARFESKAQPRPADDRARALTSASKAQPSSASERSRALTSVSAWTHTIVLTGELTHRSAYALEVEIERLCAEGVTGITLDLRKLEQIDAVGVAVVAFRGGLCRRRGYDFAVIPGSPSMRRAFEHAGVLGLPIDEADGLDKRDETDVPAEPAPQRPRRSEKATPQRPRALALARAPRDQCG